MQISYLSYPFTQSIPVYGGTDNLELTSLKDMKKGDSCNTWRLCFENHWGTHVDCPAHFFMEGQEVSDYPPDFWLFRKPQVIQIEAKAGQIIRKDDFLIDLDHETDLILFQSGWWKFRGEEIYRKYNPGLHPDLGLWVRQDFPAVRAIGMDWISISSFKKRELGRAAHKAFLNPDGESHPILIIEDMDLSADLNGLKEVWVAPLLVEMIDSAPCTIIGIIKN